MTIKYIWTICDKGKNNIYCYYILLKCICLKNRPPVEQDLPLNRKASKYEIRQTACNSEIVLVLVWEKNEQKYKSDNLFSPYFKTNVTTTQPI